MGRQKSRVREITFILILLSTLLCVALYIQCVQAEDEVGGDSYFTMIDEEGKAIFSTAITLSPGDIFIAEDNRSYEVMKVEGRTAHARFTGKVDLVCEESTLQKLFGYISAFFGRRNDQPIVIYHTHSDESYVPTSGTDSKYWGDVYQVGRILRNEIERQGFKVIHALENHNPHDGAAYERSRRTLVKYLKQNPIACIDVHRDAVPPEVYRTVVNGKPVTKVTLVIGRQNQNRDSNIQFAKSIKNETDSKHPGLIRGILIARGNYNQDVGPRMMLVEVGAHTNSLEEAERAASLFASTLPSVVYGTTPTGARGMGRESSSAGRTAIWVLIIGVIGVGLYVTINSGGFGGFVERLKNSTGAEMTNSLGTWLRRRSKRRGGGGEGEEGKKE